MDWKSFTVIYDDDEALLRLQAVFKGHDGRERRKGHAFFTIHQLGEDSDYR